MTQSYPPGSLSPTSHSTMSHSPFLEDVTTANTAGPIVVTAHVKGVVARVAFQPSLTWEGRHSVACPSEVLPVVPLAGSSPLPFHLPLHRPPPSSEAPSSVPPGIPPPPQSTCHINGMGGSWLSGRLQRGFLSQKWGASGWSDCHGLTLKITNPSQALYAVPGR